MFVAPRREEIKRKLEENAQLYLAIDVKVQNKPVPVEYFHNNRLGEYRFVKFNVTQSCTVPNLSTILYFLL